MEGLMAFFLANITIYTYGRPREIFVFCVQLILEPIFIQFMTHAACSSSQALRSYGKLEPKLHEAVREMLAKEIEGGSLDEFPGTGGWAKRAGCFAITEYREKRGVQGHLAVHQDPKGYLPSGRLRPQAKS